MRGLDAEIRRLTAAAREGTATTGELGSSSFTLNNYGGLGRRSLSGLLRRRASLLVAGNSCVAPEGQHNRDEASLRSWAMNTWPAPTPVTRAPAGVAYGDATGSAEPATPAHPYRDLSGPC